jgi:hypothetical protein
MLNPDIEPLVRALSEASDLLRRHGDIRTAARLEHLLGRLAVGDTMGIVGAVSEATGGMGSLRDRYLCVENGDLILGEDTKRVNEQLDALVKEVERSAREAAAALGIELVR